MNSDRVLVGKEAAEFLKSRMTQTVQETCRGVKITIDPMPNTKRLEMEVIVRLIDSLIADDQPEELEANLYSARLHMVRALKEVA